MRALRVPRWAVLAIAISVLGYAGFATRGYWQPWLKRGPATDITPSADESTSPTDRVVLSDQALANLGIVAKPLTPTSYWKMISVPGIIVDRPGQGDRSIIAPVTGVVNAIQFVPGDTVRPGDVLLTLELLSESLHQTQTELFKTAQDTKLAVAIRDRLRSSGGSIPEMRLIEADNQVSRLEIAAKAYRQELTTRGFTSEQIAAVSEGRFVREISIAVPPRPVSENTAQMTAASKSAIAPERTFEVQELKVELGQQVQAGQTLCILASHQVLTIEGHAFRDETPLLERAVRENWPIEVDFQEPAGSDWPPVAQQFFINWLASTIDPVDRTFSFFIPLENQSQTVERNGHSRKLWRFRPGQKVRLHVPVEKLENVFVLPTDAVTFDGAEAYTFTQNVNTFVRRPLRVLLRDRHHVVIANDGAIIPGSFAVQSAAAQLNRMVKSQSSSVPKGFHIHADGSVHKNDENE
jgi:cobalt-zinc-cadmium efflux system membrane fusion protein